MHDVTVSAAVTSFEFLVSEIFNGNTPPKIYIYVKKTVDGRCFLRFIRFYGENLTTFNNQYAYDLPFKKITILDL
jgi:hypothetical protein